MWSLCQISDLCNKEPTHNKQTTFLLQYLVQQESYGLVFLRCSGNLVDSVNKKVLLTPTDVPVIHVPSALIEQEASVYKCNCIQCSYRTFGACKQKERQQPGCQSCLETRVALQPNAICVSSD